MINFLLKYKIYYYIINPLFIFIYLFPGSLLGCIFFNDCFYQPQLTPDFIISSNHLYGFIILSSIGYFIYKNSKNFNFLILYLISLSIILEFFHFIIPNRDFEIRDLFGNLIGVVIVIIINFFLNNEKFKN
tara:strand:+ start:316 stop:708 length:393 start_codon:yes stop_codon:yes gene_type:complete